MCWPLHRFGPSSLLIRGGYRYNDKILFIKLLKSLNESLIIKLDDPLVKKKPHPVTYRWPKDTCPNIFVNLNGQPFFLLTTSMVTPSNIDYWPNEEPISIWQLSGILIELAGSIRGSFGPVSVGNLRLFRRPCHSLSLIRGPNPDV